MFVVSIIGLLYKLDTLQPGLSMIESTQANSIISDSTYALENGIFLPYNLLQTLLIETLGTSVFSLRLASAIFGFLSLIMMFVLIHLWHREKIAIAAVFFFATSSWFLTTARMGTPQIYIGFSLILIFLSGTLIRHSKRPKLAVIFSAIALPLALYSPYMIYIFGLYLFLYRKEIKSLAASIDKSSLASFLMLGAAAMVPLIYSFVANPDNLTSWLGFSGNLPSLSEYFSNIFRSLNYFLWTSTNNPVHHLANLSYLDIFTSTMVALGLYHYEQHYNFLRTRLIIYGLGLSILLFGLTNDEANYFLVAPILYILAATGVVTLLNQWNKIFPINPLARTIALIPMALAVLFTSQYHIERYFYAWANNPSVRRVYPIEPSLMKDYISQHESKRILIITDDTEHSALIYLLNDVQQKSEISLIKPSDNVNYQNLTKSYDYVIVSSESSSDPIREQLNQFKSSEISSNRKSRPVAYFVYDLQNS